MEETPDCILQCSDIVKERKKVKLTIVFPKFFLLVIQFASGSSSELNSSSALKFSSLPKQCKKNLLLTTRSQKRNLTACNPNLEINKIVKLSQLLNNLLL
jgi:hypothetical protein